MIPLPFKTKKARVEVSFSVYHGVRALVLAYSLA